MEACETCGGKGIMDCSLCGGTGMARYDTGHGNHEVRECTYCEGVGGRSCEDCFPTESQYGRQPQEASDAS